MSKELSNYPWIKFHVTWLNEPAFMRLSAAAVGTFTRLYLLAARAGAGGLIGKDDTIYNAEDIAFLLHIPADESSAHLDELTRARLIVKDGDGWQIVKFPEEQGPGLEEQRKKWAKDQANHRARMKKENSPEDKKEEAEQIKGREEKEKEKTTDKNRIEGHADVRLTPPDRGNDEPVKPSSSFFDLFSLDGELTPEILDHFKEQGKAFGRITLGSYLEYASENGWSWGKAYNADRKEGLIEKWEVREKKSKQTEGTWQVVDGQRVFVEKAAPAHIFAESYGFSDKPARIPEWTGRNEEETERTRKAGDTPRPAYPRNATKPAITTPDWDGKRE